MEFTQSTNLSGKRNVVIFYFCPNNARQFFHTISGAALDFWTLGYETHEYS